MFAQPTTGRPGLALLSQTVLRQPAIYKKTPVQSVADLTVYIRTISEHVDLTCILCIVYFFVHFHDLHPDWPDIFCEDYPPAHRGLATPSDCKRSTKNIRYTIYTSGQHAR